MVNKVTRLFRVKKGHCVHRIHYHFLAPEICAATKWHIMKLTNKGINVISNVNNQVLTFISRDLDMT